MPTTWRHAISGDEIERPDALELHYPWIRADRFAARDAAQAERIHRARTAARDLVARRLTEATAPPKPRARRRPKAAPDESEEGDF